MSVNWKPAGSHTVTPYLVARNADAALAYYEKIFGAKVTVLMKNPAGKINHAEFHIGDSTLMITEENIEHNIKSPLTVGGGSISFAMYVPDCDAVFKAAVDSGATVIKPVADQFYGDRSGLVIDPFGHVWNIATHIEDVSPEEMKRRMAQFMASSGEKSGH